MLINTMLKILKVIFILNFFFTNAFSENNEFQLWLETSYNSTESELVVNDVMSNAKFLPKVIEYDISNQFYEDTLHI